MKISWSVFCVPTAMATAVAVSLTTAEEVSETCITGTAVLPAGADMRYAVTEVVSPRFWLRKLIVATAAEAVEVSDVSCVEAAAERVIE
jgi:hypothetical protein